MSTVPNITLNNQSIVYSPGIVTIVKASSNSSGALTYSLGSGPTNTTVSSTGLVTIVGVGTINVLVSQLASGIYSAITSPVAAGTITVTGIVPIIIPAQTQLIDYSPGKTVTVTATSSSNAALTYSLKIGSPTGTSINSSSGLVTIGGPGTIIVNVSQAATGNYAATNTIAGTIIVNGITPSIIPALTQYINYSNNITANVSVTSPSSSGALTYSLRSGPTGTTVSSTGLVTISNAGTINVNVSQVASGNYSAVTQLAGSIVVLPSLSIIKQASLQTIEYLPTMNVSAISNNSTGAFTYSLESGPSGTSITSTGVLTIGGITDVTSNDGIIILATQAASTNYSAITTPVRVANIKVIKANPTITTSQPSQITYSSTYQFTATSTSGGTILYYLGSGPTGTSITTSGVVTIGGVGTIQVVVSQAQDMANKYKAISVLKSITVIQATPTITNNSVTIPYSSTYQFTATSNSGGALIYSLGSGSPSSTSINSTTGLVTIGGVGTINVLVSQVASTNYIAITTPVAAGTITVIQATIPTITTNNSIALKSPYSGTYQFSATSNSSGALTYYKKSISTTGSVSSTGIVTITGIGTIYIQVTQLASGSFAAITTPVDAGTITVTAKLGMG